MVATLVGVLGDIELAEDAAQEAFAIAAERWPHDGVPDAPRAWLVTTARNRAIDRLRRARTLREKTERLARELPLAAPPDEPAMDDDAAIPDERLELLFTCCHPALAIEAQVALTLRTLTGLTTEQIARAFLVSPETMKRRLTRAKGKIRDAGIPFRVPSEDQLGARLAAVLAVVYLVFNEGYGGREPLAAEAVRLGETLVALLPDEPEPAGLLALMLLHHARRRARFADGDLVLLADQDRDAWDQAALDRGRALLDDAVARGGRGGYVLQAAIAALELEDPPDWPQIAGLYGELERRTGSTVVRLNRAVAVAESEGPAAGLALTDELREPLDGYPYLHATRGELLRRLNREPEAQEAFARALALAAHEPDRRFLRRRLGEG
ncbi:RNA polymerase sigma factor [Patulibacter defluvii]|uniref:RNA polymerase sigma factor n=1 Tax=Patulibacter defluvii TaxID=3095358 RepID=UPI002A751980|nr:sigma-70 family RNA polymerase sigma factor [Patulibacter sp. DM4]